MPRIKPLTPEIRREREFDALVEYHMKTLGYKKIDLAKRLCLTPDAYSYRSAHKTAWNYFELMKLFHVLQFTPEEISRVFTIK